MSITLTISQGLHLIKLSMPEILKNQHDSLLMGPVALEKDSYIIAYLPM
jgi:hypothetical protein